MAFEYPVVAVVWGDAWEETEEPLDPEDFQHRPLMTTTVGFLLRRDAIGLTMFTEYDEEEKLRTSNFIPAGMIVSVTELVLPGPHPSPAE